VESPFHGPNARAALQLAHARGVVLACLGQAGIQVAEYSPATIKKAITGTGKADKEQVQAMVRRLLGNPADESRDVSDALAVAYCHLASSGFAAASRRAGPVGARPGSRLRSRP
jgi:crossover junction endodeoxyribonuclease RuvC